MLVSSRFRPFILNQTRKCQAAGGPGGIRDFAAEAVPPPRITMQRPDS